MAGTYGVTENTGTEVSQLIAGDFRAMKKVTIAAGADLTRGAVLGQVTADYKFAQLNPAGADGTEVARAILAEDAAAASADVEANIYLVGEYRLADLVWPGSITDPQKNAAIQQLADRGIIVK
jgi:hypothetical protein